MKIKKIAGLILICMLLTLFTPLTAQAYLGPEPIIVHDGMLNLFLYEKTINMADAPDRTQIPNVSTSFYLKEAEEFEPKVAIKTRGKHPLILRKGDIQEIMDSADSEEDRALERVPFSTVTFTSEDVYFPELATVMKMPMKSHYDCTYLLNSVLQELAKRRFPDDEEYEPGISYASPEVQAKRAEYLYGLLKDPEIYSELKQMTDGKRSKSSQHPAFNIKVDYLLKFAQGRLIDKNYGTSYLFMPWTLPEEEKLNALGDGTENPNWLAFTWLKDTVPYKGFWGNPNPEEPIEEVFTWFDISRRYSLEAILSRKFFFMDIQRDNLLSDIQMDEGGYTSISKPLVMPKEMMAIFDRIIPYDLEQRDSGILWDILDDQENIVPDYDDLPENEGKEKYNSDPYNFETVYRYKLVEDTSGTDFAPNREEKIIDFYIKNELSWQEEDDYRKYEKYDMVRYRIFDTEDEANTFFENYAQIYPYKEDGTVTYESDPGMLPVFDYTQPVSFYWHIEPSENFKNGHEHGLTEEERQDLGQIFEEKTEEPEAKIFETEQNVELRLLTPCSFTNRYTRPTPPPTPPTPPTSEEPVVEKVWRDKDGNAIEAPTDQIEIELVDDRGKILSEWVVMEGQDWQVDVDEEDFTVYEVGEKNGKITIDDKTYEVKYEKTENGYRIINILIEKEPETPSIPSIPSTPSNPPNKPSIKIPMIPKAGAY